MTKPCCCLPAIVLFNEISHQILFNLLDCHTTEQDWIIANIGQQILSIVQWHIQCDWSGLNTRSGNYTESLKFLVKFLHSCSFHHNIDLYIFCYYGNDCNTSWGKFLVFKPSKGILLAHKKIKVDSFVPKNNLQYGYAIETIQSCLPF